MEAWSSRQGPESVVIPVGLTGMTTDSVAYSVAYLGGPFGEGPPVAGSKKFFGTESVIFAFNLAPKPSKFMSISKNRSLSPILVLNIVFGKEVPNRSSVPNLKLLASTVAEISRGSQIFLEATLAQTHANFGPKRCFW